VPRVRAKPAVLTASVYEKSVADGSSDVSNETLGAYPGSGLSGTAGDVAADAAPSVRGTKGEFRTPGEVVAGGEEQGVPGREVCFIAERKGAGGSAMWVGGASIVVVVVEVVCGEIERSSSSSSWDTEGKQGPGSRSGAVFTFLFRLSLDPCVMSAPHSPSSSPPPAGVLAPESITKKEPTIDDEGETEAKSGSETGSAKDEASGSDGSEDDDKESSPAASDSVKVTENARSSTTATAAAPSTEWQAIWSPAHNAYYFFNPTTQETTWVNPLQPPQPEASTSSEGNTIAKVPTAEDVAAAAVEAAQATSSSSTSNLPPHLRQLYQAQAAAEAAGIDPALAYLDPSLALPGGAGVGGGAYSATARFNAHTGAFAKTDARDPSHLSEYSRMQRMSQFYFDTDQWERDVEKRKAEELEAEEAGARKRKPTKKDLVRVYRSKKERSCFWANDIWACRSALKSKRSRKSWQRRPGYETRNASVL
jgi:hypothetical protein